MKACKKCGKKVSEFATECPSCGVILDADNIIDIKEITANKDNNIQPLKKIIYLPMLIVIVAMIVFTIKYYKISIEPDNDYIFWWIKVQIIPILLSCFLIVANQKRGNLGFYIAKTVFICSIIFIALGIFAGIEYKLIWRTFTENNREIAKIVMKFPTYDFAIYRGWSRPSLFYIRILSYWGFYIVTAIIARKMYKKVK